MTSPTKLPSPLSPAERALKDSLDPPDFRDVHLYAFSQRRIYQDGSIRIDHPLPIVAVGSVLKDTEHFSKLLTSGFAEAKTDHSGEDTIRHYARESEYDYESDSDLDEFEEHEDMQTPVSASSSSTKGKSKELEEGGNGPESLSTETDMKGEKVHRIFIVSFAYRTLKACIFYLYTEKVNFLPLTSKGRAERQFALLTGSSTFAPACSPKSMYRLAEAYGIKKLQDLAYDEIVSQLNTQNILSEAFSSFFARYPRLREHVVSYISRNYSSPTIQEALPDLIERIVAGNMPHAGDVLRSLLGLRIAVTSPQRVVPARTTVNPFNTFSNTLFSRQTVSVSSSVQGSSTLQNASVALSGFTWRNYALDKEEEEVDKAAVEPVKEAAEEPVEEVVQINAEEPCPASTTSMRMKKKKGLKLKRAA